MAGLIIKCIFRENGRLVERKRILPVVVTKINSRTITQIIQGKDSPLERYRRVYKKYFGWVDVPIERRSELIKIILPEGITEIDEFTFYGCYELKEVVIPNSVIKICNYAFLGCTELRKVIISARVKIPQQLNIVEICKDAFLGCPKFNNNIIISNSI